VAFNALRATPLSLEVYDLRGRRIQQVHHGAVGVGAQNFVWDGRNANGRTVASGRYFVVARFESGYLKKSVLLLR
jgi:flagellar hook assembly protein FlgD